MGNTSSYINNKQSKQNQSNNTITDKDFWNQFFILFHKRYIVQKRDKKGTFFLIILPIIIITLAFAILVIENNPVGPPLVFDMDLLGHGLDDNSNIASSGVGGGVDSRNNNEENSNTGNGWEDNITKQVLFGYNNRLSYDDNNLMTSTTNEEKKEEYDNINKMNIEQLH